MNPLVLVFPVLVLCGCATPRIMEDYVGESYPSVADVRTIGHAGEIGEDCKVMGKAFVHVPARGRLSEQEARNRIIAQARTHGADAVLFADPAKRHTESFRSAGHRSHNRNHYDLTYSATFLKCR